MRSSLAVGLSCAIYGHPLNTCRPRRLTRVRSNPPSLAMRIFLLRLSLISCLESQQPIFNRGAEYYPVDAEFNLEPFAKFV